MLNNIQNFKKVSVVKSQLKALDGVVNLLEVPKKWRKKVKYYLAVVHLGVSCDMLAKTTGLRRVRFENNLIRLGIRFNKNKDFAGFMKNIALRYNEVSENNTIAA